MVLNCVITIDYSAVLFSCNTHTLLIKFRFPTRSYLLEYTSVGRANYIASTEKKVSGMTASSKQ